MIRVIHGVYSFANGNHALRNLSNGMFVESRSRQYRGSHSRMRMGWDKDVFLKYICSNLHTQWTLGHPSGSIYFLSYFPPQRPQQTECHCLDECNSLQAPSIQFGTTQFLWGPKGPKGRTSERKTLTSARRWIDLTWSNWNRPCLTFHLRFSTREMSADYFSSCIGSSSWQPETIWMFMLVNSAFWIK